MGRERGKRLSEDIGITPSSTVEGEECPSLWDVLGATWEYPHVEPTAACSTALYPAPPGAGLHRIPIISALPGMLSPYSFLFPVLYCNTLSHALRLTAPASGKHRKDGQVWLMEEV